MSMEETLNSIIDENVSNEFEIKDDNSAEWAIKKIQAEKTFESVCDSMILEYQSKKRNAKKEFESKTSFLKNKLNDYFNQNRDKTHKTKTMESYKLPSGKLVLNNEKNTL